VLRSTKAVDVIVLKLKELDLKESEVLASVIPKLKHWFLPLVSRTKAQKSKSP
jgi:hypothetical protein